MFGKNKHVYTCPDVIHDRARAKKNARTTIGLNLLMVAGFWSYGKILEARENKPNLTIVPDPAS